MFITIIVCIDCIETYYYINNNFYLRNTSWKPECVLGFNMKIYFHDLFRLWYV